MVMARRLVQQRYAGLVTDQATFGREASTLHRRLTSLSDTAGGWQVPWPRAIGTPPWAVARELRLLTGAPYAVRLVRLRRRMWPAPARRRSGRGRPRSTSATASCPVTSCSSRRSTTPARRRYEPASGRTLTVDRGRWERGDLALAGWDRPWLVVSPR